MRRPKHEFEGGLQELNRGDYVKSTSCGSLSWWQKLRGKQPSCKIAVGIVDEWSLGRFNSDADANRAICSSMHKRKTASKVWRSDGKGNYNRTHLKCKAH